MSELLMNVSRPPNRDSEPNLPELLVSKKLILESIDHVPGLLRLFVKVSCHFPSVDPSRQKAKHLIRSRPVAALLNWSSEHTPRWISCRYPNYRNRELSCPR